MLNRARVRSLRKVKNDLGLHFTVHAPFEDLNIATLNKGRRRLTLTRMSESLELAADLEAEVWVVHPGMSSGLGWVYPNNQWRLNLESLRLFRDKAEGSGLIVAVENMPSESFILSSEKDVSRLLSVNYKVNKIKITRDVGHANILRDLDGFLKFLMEKIVEVHLHDNYGSIDEHNAIGQGTVDWTRLFRSLVDKRFRGFVIVESIRDVIESYRRVVRVSHG
ncbi:MAG: sugar phosphate isomerase/epimerase family protein [Candidatus Bathyarchaeia archaeon]